MYVDSHHAYPIPLRHQFHSPLFSMIVPNSLTLSTSDKPDSRFSFEHEKTAVSSLLTVAGRVTSWKSLYRNLRTSPTHDSTCVWSDASTYIIPGQPPERRSTKHWCRSAARLRAATFLREVI